MNNILLGSEDSKRLADFYANVLGDPNPDADVVSVLSGLAARADDLESAVASLELQDGDVGSKGLGRYGVRWVRGATPGLAVLIAGLLS